MTECSKKKFKLGGISIMQLGARGVLEVMNSFGGLTSASKFWSPGDRVAYIFPVTGKDELGNPIIPVAHELGHKINKLSDNFKRSFIPTKSVIDPKTRQVIEPDFAYQVAGIFRALLDGDKARKIARAKEDAPNEAAAKNEIADIEEDFKKKYPVVSRLTAMAYTEVAVCKLDENNAIIGGAVKLDHGGLNISKKKLGQLIQRTTVAGAYDGGNYFYIVMQTDTGDKNLAGQVDWNAVTDPEKKIEKQHPDFAEKVTAFFNAKQITEDSIKAKVYDFKDYDVEQFKQEVATYVAGRMHYLKDTTGNFHEFVVREDNIETLRNLNMLADAETIEKILNAKKADEHPALQEAEQVEQNIAQTIDLTKV